MTLHADTCFLFQSCLEEAPAASSCCCCGHSDVDVVRMVAALQDSQWQHLGADGGVDGEHRRVHGVGVPEGGWRAALHQPPQARPPRRPHRGQGEPHPVPRPRRVLGQGMCAATAAAGGGVSPSDSVRVGLVRWLGFGCVLAGLIARSAVGRGALDPAGDGALGRRPPRRRLLDCPVSPSLPPSSKPQPSSFPSDIGIDSGSLLTEFVSSSHTEFGTSFPSCSIVLASQSHMN